MMVCAHLLVHPDRDGRVRVRQNKAYKCTVTVPWPDLPNSIYRSSRIFPAPAHVEPKQCDGCPYYTKKEKGQ